jgi:hypothetical protein
MKAVIASRQTECSHCKNPIEKGDRRLDDIVRLHERIVRFHYHPVCWNERVEEFFKNAEFEREQEPEKRERVLLKDTLTSEQMHYRHSLLARLSSLKSYYTPKLNFRSVPSELSPNDWIKFQNYHLRREAILSELAKNGGIPSNHRSNRQLVVDVMPDAGEKLDEKEEESKLVSFVG